MIPNSATHRGSLWRGLLFQSCLYLWSILFLTISLPFIFFDTTERFIGTFWSRGVLRLLKITTGLDSTIEQQQHLPTEPYIIAAQHQSAWDTIVFQCFLPAPVYVLKRELWRIPLFGWHLRRYGSIGIRRNGGRRALVSMIRDARWFLEEGRKIILIFPQGSRTRPGEKRPAQSGVVALYRSLELPVVPAVVNSGLFWPRHNLRIRSGKAIVRFAPPIPTGLSKAEFLKTLEESWDKHGTALLAEEAATTKAS